MHASLPRMTHQGGGSEAELDLRNRQIRKEGGAAMHIDPLFRRARQFALPWRVY
jgi:hypothetical protein